MTIIEQSMQYPTGYNFSQEGCGYPRRSNFRFSKKQKHVLYKIFFDGEESGKKLTPEEAFNHIRKEKLLEVNEYIILHQHKFDHYFQGR